MASGLLKAGVDLDTLFMARVTAKRADVGLRVAGVDISNRYEKIGDGTAIAATGFKATGFDIASLFRNISQPLGTHTLTAGLYTYGTPNQNMIGYYRAITGAISPTTFRGSVIEFLADQTDEFSPGFNGLAFQINQEVTSAFLTSIVINGATFLASAASFESDINLAVWRWPTKANLSPSVIYPVTLSPP